MNLTRAFTGVATAVLAAATLAGCVAESTPTTDPSQGANSEILSDLGLEGQDVRTVVGTLDTMPVAERPAGLATSINATHLLLSDGTGVEEQIALPGDEIYVSIAPYLTTTHDCYYHSPTSCIGELAHADVDLTVTDSATGEPLVEGTYATFDNGFLGFWLPRGLDTDITVGYDGHTATTSLSTAGDDAQTCITTLPLVAP